MASEIERPKTASSVRLEFDDWKGGGSSPPANIPQVTEPSTPGRYWKGGGSSPPANIPQLTKPSTPPQYTEPSTPRRCMKPSLKKLKVVAVGIAVGILIAAVVISAVVISGDNQEGTSANTEFVSTTQSPIETTGSDQGTKSSSTTTTTTTAKPSTSATTPLPGTPDPGTTETTPISTTQSSDGTTYIMTTTPTTPDQGTKSSSTTTKTTTTTAKTSTSATTPLPGTPDPGTTETTTTVISTTQSSDETTSILTTTPATPAGNWTEWGSWTPCTATCGFGTYKRYRQCISPSGEICIGDPMQLGICPNEDCLVYGKWSTWSEWGSCGKSCGTGSQIRKRVCDKIDISDLDCVGDELQSQQCSTWKCPDCSQSCDVGYLNDECDTCVCDGTDISGRVVIESTEYGIRDANIFAASAPTRLLTSSNSTGFFSLMSVCLSSELYVSREGFLDKIVTVIETTLTVTMAVTVQPHFTKTPQSKSRLSGENVTLYCEAEGVPDIAYYEWFRDGLILDKTFYPEDTALYLKDVRTTNSGAYKCRANSPVGAKMSSEAQLQVKDTSEDFCVDALVKKTKLLPSDCIQPLTNTATYEVGECVSKQCRLNGSIDYSTGLDDTSSCCTAGQTEMKTVQCPGYTLDIFIVNSCSCAHCTADSINVDSIKVSGTAKGINTNSPLIFGEVWVNGNLETYTSVSGKYSLFVSKQTDEIVLAFVDTYYRQFLPSTKVIQMPDLMSGTIRLDVTLANASPPIEIQSDEENVISVNSSSVNSSTGAVLSIPANSFFYPNGTQYGGTVTATITFLDPSNPSDRTYLPADFEFVNEEGETGNLASLGVFNFFFQDSYGNDISVIRGINVYLPGDIATHVNVDDFKLWKLDQGTGKWELMSLYTSGGKVKRQWWLPNYLQYIGSIDPSQVSRYRWLNIDKIDKQDKCYIKLRIFKGADLEDEITNFNRYISFKQHWLVGRVFYSFFVRYSYKQNLYEQCGRAACNDLTGFITAWGYGQTLFPGNFTGKFPGFSYAIDGSSSQVKFSETSTGPFFNNKQTCMTTSNSPSGIYVPFHYDKSVKDYTANEFYDFSNFNPGELSEQKNRSDRTWYVNRQPEGHRVCFVKVKLKFHSSFKLYTGDVLILRITSKGGTVLNATFGIRDLEITDTSKASTWCMEYKCSGTVSPDFNDNPLIDETNVQIEITGVKYANCVVESESSSLTSDQSQIGKQVVSFNAPVTPTPIIHGMYYVVTDKGQDEVLNYKIDDAENKCKSGNDHIDDEDNPDIGVALTMLCQRNCRYWFWGYCSVK